MSMGRTVVQCVAILVAAGFLAACGSDGDGARYSLGGSVSGLSGAGLELANGTDRLSIPANGAFTFSERLRAGASYAVAVRNHPAGQGCVVTNGSGAVAEADISNVQVVCSSAGPLALSSVNPANGSFDVSRRVAPNLVFSAPLSAATANSANVKLRTSQGEQSIHTAVAGNALAVAPGTKLLPLTRYTLTVGTGLRGSSGEQLPAELALGFTTADGAWQARQLRSQPGTNSLSDPRIAMSANGDAVAFWSESEGAQLWAARYQPGSGWSFPVLIDSSSGASLLIHGAEMDAAGNALLLWIVSDGYTCGGDSSCVQFAVRTRRFTPGGGWGSSATLAEGRTRNIVRAQLAMNRNGQAAVVWNEVDGPDESIWARRYSPESGWSRAELLEGAPGGAEYADADLDADGNILAVWSQREGARSSTWSNRYAAGTGWSTPVLLETDDAGSTWMTRIVMDASGNALAVWMQSDGTRYNLWSNRYQKNSGWSGPQLVETSNSGDVLSVDLAADAHGNFVTVWEESDRSFQGAHNDAWTNRHTTGAGWGTAERLETSDAGSASLPRVAVDPAGNALVLWSQHDGTRYNMWSRRYLPAFGWGGPVLLEADDGGDAVFARVAMDGSGDAIGLWVQRNGVLHQAYSARFE
jgi:hypothetical protein